MAEVTDLILPVVGAGLTLKIADVVLDEKKTKKRKKRKLKKVV
jgi:hypothetical protein